jgi:hypothetical protein
MWTPLPPPPAVPHPKTVKELAENPAPPAVWLVWDPWYAKVRGCWSTERAARRQATDEEVVIGPYACATPAVPAPVSPGADPESDDEEDEDEDEDEEDDE